MSDSQADYQELVGRYKEYTTLSSVTGLLHWDMQTVMPPKGNERRADQIALLSGIMHTRLTSPRIGELVEQLLSKDGLADEQQANVREMARDYHKATRIPQELVEELSRQQSLAHEAWVHAREAANFAFFAPHLERLVRLTAQMAEHLGYEDTPLDALIDQFEPDATTAMFTHLFDELKAVNIPLLQRILNSPVKADRRFLETEYSPDLQKEFGEVVMRQVGFDSDAGRLDTSVHPFCSGAWGDVRITTRYNSRAPQQALFGVIHETGHALYEQGVNERYLGTPLAEALSYGIHESQSRMWENFVGRSKPFWKHFLPRLKQFFPSQLGDVTLDQFLLATNHVQPSLVRVEADEMTYDLHIIMRFEIERDLFAGKITVSELPVVWNRKMESYLGVTPPNDGKEGVLQDVHWSGGSFGYFPSYSLGNIAAAQFWYTMRAAMPDMDEQIARGKFANILAWLRENVHQQGRRFKRDELMKRATGKPLQTGDYIRYLKEKYSELYKL
jgi:carboxypeptidase Taq